jgi:hypothetical protein
MTGRTLKTNLRKKKVKITQLLVVTTKESFTTTRYKNLIGRAQRSFHNKPGRRTPKRVAHVVVMLAPLRFTKTRDGP